ncbi:uncharacterized protein LOC106401565 isoform X1 [Brassica napus]|uniref:(rape) hypothetical protein n=1 Tax=Brassica napus TaxID=3708 RepID=A0A816KFZ0_BRANA|nr:uncharacterized protein LOC106401565 isoform X1 [Brassica napus]CAF1924939.1 unnamed protein product [Brassica napus]
MSKKKAAGSTMTLKDFHGGSIPSDLALPSAPGVVPKITTDRPFVDRAAPWGGRPDQRTRPSSSHTLRNFDDKSLFLPHTANIGRNFSEDERKPLDGHSAPRRMVSDDVFLVANSRLEVKADPGLTGRHGGWSAAAGNGESSVSGTHTNVWAARKEVPVLVANDEAGRSSWSTQPPVSNLVHSSALEQVSSGRWQTKLLVPSQMGFDVVKHSEMESRGYKGNSHVLNQGDGTHGTYVERGLVAEEGIHGGRKFGREYEKLPGPTYLDAKEVKAVPHPNYSEVRPAGHFVQPTAPSEAVERPKLNLLPRTKPIESVEKPLNDGKMENGVSNLIQRETGYVAQKSMNVSKPGLSADEIPNKPVERPKLNLKPVAQLLEKPEVKTEKERNAVFGGARPRELVLKERGIDETEHQKLEQQLERTVLNPIERVPVPEHAVQRPVSSPRELRTRKFDQKDVRSVSDVARSETQRRNWRDNDVKNPRQQPQAQEKSRHPSPETWRKPVPQKPESPDGTGHRPGKAASPLELAQAYSDTKSGTGSSSFNMSRNNQTQQPFSRLVGSTTTKPKHINGY